MSAWSAQDMEMRSKLAWTKRAMERAVKARSQKTLQGSEMYRFTDSRQRELLSRNYQCLKMRTRWDTANDIHKPQTDNPNLVHQSSLRSGVQAQSGSLGRDPRTFQAYRSKR
ncbi:hypothetical protein BDZ85DRAFT_105953 [Elsinoe ampelina]|uniref:Uncharacterized protein n=1 Tax=Elsinoe ampelina TaxID=302913 RepID=A0A6A6FYH7_9PEZI|nr:hypothetical protein BDZ85DRAFT_105953 [Elsinoe ampelina]